MVVGAWCWGVHWRRCWERGRCGGSSGSKSCKNGGEDLHDWGKNEAGENCYLKIKNLLGICCVVFFLDCPENSLVQRVGGCARIE